MLNWPLRAWLYNYIWNTKVWMCSFSRAYKKYLFSNVEISVALWWKGAISPPTMTIKEDLPNDVISRASPGHQLLLLFYWVYFIKPFILEPLAELQWFGSHCCQSIRMKVNIFFFPCLSVHLPLYGWMDGWMDGWMEGWEGGTDGACFGISKIHHHRGIVAPLQKSVDTNLCGQKKWFTVKIDLIFQRSLLISTSLDHAFYSLYDENASVSVQWQLMRKG